MPLAIYTRAQIGQFYDRISLPTKWRVDFERAKSFTRSAHALEYLEVLQRYTLAHIPFENLELHYSREKTIDLDPEALFRKIVIQNTGRGGYCMENNTLLAVVLRTLGFDVMSTGGRVNTAASSSTLFNESPNNENTWLGLAHMVNIVTIKGARYLVDVGFGAGSSTRPLLLEDGITQLNIRPDQSIRLRYDTLNECENPTSKFWILEKQNKKNDKFLPCYCFFNNVEFLPADFTVMNHFTSTSNKIFFTQTIVAVIHILSHDGKEIVGETVLVGDKLYQRIYGWKGHVKVCNTEDERVAALEKNLGIILSASQRHAIMGMRSMIR